MLIVCVPANVERNYEHYSKVMGAMTYTQMFNDTICAASLKFFFVSAYTLLNVNSLCRWSVLMAEGVEPVSREWQRALGLQDCMVMVGGRLDIPDFEPIPVTNDSMCTAVEILWSRPRPSAKSQTGDHL